MMKSYIIFFLVALVSCFPEQTTLFSDNLLVGQIIPLDDLCFEADHVNLNDPKSQVALDQLFTLLRENPNMRIEVGGHASGHNAGLKVNEAYSQHLSRERADVVVHYLQAKGISIEQLVSKGYGNSNPLFSNDSGEGRAKNRRIEIKVLRI